jgi:hypothetical protein
MYCFRFTGVSRKRSLSSKSELDSSSKPKLYRILSKSLLSIFEKILDVIFDLNLKPWIQNPKAYFS